jgi:hypothetical protein
LLFNMRSNQYRFMLNKRKLHQNLITDHKKPLYTPGVNRGHCG